MLCAVYFNGKSSHEMYHHHSLRYRALAFLHVLTAVAALKSNEKEDYRFAAMVEAFHVTTFDYACPIPNKNSDGKHAAVPIRCDMCHATFLFFVQMIELLCFSMMLHDKFVFTNICMNVKTVVL